MTLTAHIPPSKGADWSTVGTTGADYTTIQAAVDDGKTKLKLITDITASSNVTLPDDYCLTIDLNTKIATFETDVQILGGHSVEVIDRTGYRKGEVQFSVSGGDINLTYQGITATYSECRGIIVRNLSTSTGTYNLNQFFKKHFDCDYYLTNSNKNVIQLIEASKITGMGSSSAINCNIIKDCTFEGTFSTSNLGNFRVIENCSLIGSPIYNITLTGENNNIICNNVKGFKNITTANVIGIKVYNTSCILFYNNADLITVENCLFTNIINNVTADKGVYKNIQYTGTATDNGTNTREWDVYQN